MKLSEYITLQEFEHSDYAVRHSIRNELPPEMFVRAEALCLACIDPIRRQFGPVFVSSGYRCAELNVKIGGAKQSQHTRGEAIDIIVPGIEPIEICRWAVDNLAAWDQLIQEGRWTHISFSEQRNRGDVLTAHFEDGRAVYANGL